MAYEPTRHSKSCLGLFCAPIVGAVIFSLGIFLEQAPSDADVPAEMLIFILFGFFFGAGPATVLLGLPVYFVLRGRVRPTPISCGLVGLGLGMVPGAVWGFIPRDGLLTAFSALGGAAGGLTFWALAHHEIEGEVG